MIRPASDPLLLLAAAAAAARCLLLAACCCRCWGCFCCCFGAATALLLCCCFCLLLASLQNIPSSNYLSSTSNASSHRLSWELADSGCCFIGMVCTVHSHIWLWVEEKFTRRPSSPKRSKKGPKATVGEFPEIPTQASKASLWESVGPSFRKATSSRLFKKGILYCNYMRKLVGRSRRCGKDVKQQRQRVLMRLML